VLKEKIVESLGIEPGSFIIKRGGVNGIELKDDTLTLL
jgi:hypothetical protein